MHRLVSAALALGVCFAAAAQGDTYAVRGSDRKGNPLAGTVTLTGTESDEGTVTRKLTANLGALSVSGDVSEAGTFVVGPPATSGEGEAADGSGEAAKPAEALAGLAAQLGGGDAGSAGSTSPPPGATPYALKPAKGRVQVKDGRLRLHLYTAEGKAIVKVSGTRETEQTVTTTQTTTTTTTVSEVGDAPAGGGGTMRATANGDQSVSPQGGPSGVPQPASKLDAAEQRTADLTSRLAEVESLRSETDEYALDDDSIDMDMTDEELAQTEQLSMAWEQLSAEHEAAVVERDQLQEEALSNALEGEDLGAAEDLVAANTRRLGDSRRLLDQTPDASQVQLDEYDRLSAHQRNAAELRDGLQASQERASLERRDLDLAEDRVRENTARFANSQVTMADDESITEAERAEHERLGELQRQAAAARDHLHDTAVSEILEEGDLAGAEALVAETTARLANSERGLEDAWDEAVVLREEHDRLKWHHTNALELRSHLMREVSEKAKKEHDLAAATTIAETAVSNLAASERQRGELTVAERAEQERLRRLHRDALALRRDVHHEVIETALKAKDFETAQRLVSEDSARLAAYAVANQTRSSSLTEAEIKEGEALIEFHQNASALRTQLFERRMQDLRLYGNPSKVQQLVHELQDGAADFEAALAERGLSDGPLPQVVVDHREALARQLREAQSLNERLK